MLDNDEMRPLAEQDIQLCTDQLQKLQEEIRIAILPKDEADQHPAIIEIRAGRIGYILSALYEYHV